jgi:hypothetical protein
MRRELLSEVQRALLRRKQTTFEDDFLFATTEDTAAA